MRVTRWRASVHLLPLVAGGCVAATMPAPPRPAALSPVASPPAPAAPLIEIGGTVAQGGLLAGRVILSSAAPIAGIRLTLDGRDVPVAADGRFIVGFGRDAPPAAILRAVSPGGAFAERRLAVTPRAWDIQSLPTLARGTTPTPAFLARRSTELAQIAAARAAGAESDGWRQPFMWPATGRISGVFGSQRIYAGEPGAFHSGVDIARPAGTAIVAPADGIVTLAAAAPFTLEGNLLMIDHGMGLNSAFLHLSRIDVRVGDRVRRGQPIGAIGATGRATGPHLHWAMKWRDERIDPQLLAGAM